VLEVIYLVFNEGYSATAGDDYMRPQLCEDALRLGRILAGLAPDEPEVHGLVALMEIHASRAGTRVGPSGEPILLLEQNRARWDQLLIQRGLAALDRAEKPARREGPTRCNTITACRARVPREKRTGRARGALRELAEVTRSPVVELNRAVAVGMAQGPAAGLTLVDALTAEPSLKGYPLLAAARADLLEKLERWDDARLEYERAASLTKNARQCERLLERAALCAKGAVAEAPQAT
jgi:predicted RNA polymerase sigma factor